jgi:unspecific monooxygenase
MQRLNQSPRAHDFVQNPYPFYEKARAAGDLFIWDEFELPMACRYDVVNALLRDRRFGREDPSQPERPPHLRRFFEIDDNSMLEREPPHHSRLRAQVLRSFTSRRVSSLGPEIEVLAHQLIDGFDSEVDLIKTFAEPLPVIVIARLLGVPEEMAPQLLDWSHRMVAMYQSRRDRAIEDAAETAAKDFSDVLLGFCKSVGDHRAMT